MKNIRYLLCGCLLAAVTGCTTVAPESPTQEPLACPAPVACPVCPLPPAPQECPPPQVVEKIVHVPAEAPPAATTAGNLNLPIIGAVETALVEPAGLLLDARIDTGAETTNIHAEDIQLVEKEGRRYVRFTLRDADGQPHPQELRLKRRVLIKQQDSAEFERRYVVRMWLSIGDTRSRIDINLSDREDFEFPLLVGRNFLLDTAIVDVSRHHTQPDPIPDPTLVPPP